MHTHTKHAPPALHPARHAVHRTLPLPFWRRLLDVTGIVIVSLGMISVIVQFLYPVDRALPFTRIGGMDVGLLTQPDLEAKLQQYAVDGEVTVQTPSTAWRAKWQSVGISVDSEASAVAAVTYDNWERAIPFSSVAKILDSRTMPLLALTDPARLENFAQQLVKNDAQAAKDAAIKVVQGEVIIDAAKNGYKFDAEEVKKQIAATAVTADTKIELVPQEVPFVRSVQSLQVAAETARNVLGRKLTLKVGDKSYSPSPQLVGTWLLFKDDEQAKNVQLAFDREAIKKYLETTINKDFSIDPGTATVTLLDGQEVGRTAAPSGKSVAVDSSIDMLVKAMEASDKTPEVALSIKDVPPRLNYVRTYSQSNGGLKAVIDDWDRDNYGDFAVIAREISGQRRYADLQPDKRFVTASTYKMFLYYALQQRIQAGELSYSDRNDIGWTVNDCMQEMIVHSTNPCAHSFMSLIGWQNAQNYINAAGFTSTTINNQSGGEKYSTVRDETNFMLRLHAGTLMGQEATDRLLGYFKRQVWRAGIPSGVPRGVTVADKVGFYNGWRHDIAIVYAPKGTYILGVMSKGGADYQFADLSRRVYAFFNK